MNVDTRCLGEVVDEHDHVCLGFDIIIDGVVYERAAMWHPGTKPGEADLYYFGHVLDLTEADHFLAHVIGEKMAVVPEFKVWQR